MWTLTQCPPAQGPGRPAACRSPHPTCQSRHCVPTSFIRRCPFCLRKNGDTFLQESESCSAVSNSLQRHELYTVHGIPQARVLEWVAFLFSRGSSRSPTLWADSLPAEPQGKPKNTGADSLSLLQRIFPTEESNPGLSHCRWILCQLSTEGSLLQESISEIMGGGTKSGDRRQAGETAGS